MRYRWALGFLSGLGVAFLFALVLENADSFKPAFTEPPCTVVQPRHHK